MDVMETYVLFQQAYIEGIRNAPTMELIRLGNTNNPPRRCAFCNGSDFVTRYEVAKDSANDYTIEELVCKDCWMPLVAEVE